MSRKRRIFDVDLPEDDGPAPDPVVTHETKSAIPGRRGPMATAIGEAGEAAQRRRAIEGEIRAENDALAQELVRLKRDGLITDRIEIGRIHVTRLMRDRTTRGDLELDDLMSSLREVGLSNPIRVMAREDGDYDLIEGFRRLSAYRALLADTRDPRWTHIPAGIVAGDASEGALYRRMVDENMVRKDISFGEMAALALSYADAHIDGCADVDEAVNRLYASAAPQKRSYIRRFAIVLRRVGKSLEFPHAIPRALGLRVADLVEGDLEAMRALVATLHAAPNRDAEGELAILRAAVEGRSAAPKTRGAPRADGRGRVVLSVPAGPNARCTAADGKIEIRAKMDFSDIGQDRLRAAIAAFFATLEE